MRTTTTPLSSQPDQVEVPELGGNRPSLAGRALLAMGLLIGFYLLAFGVVGALLYAVYIEVVVMGQINFRITLFLLLGAGVILWSLIPRPDRFVAPGPRLTAETQPQLFAEISDVARRTGQEMPAEVYLIPDVNAWVAQRGGILAIGSRRVMGIGLPLLQTLTISQLRAVIAHEFGHYYGGDTKLGPLLYHTRIAIVRAITNMANHSSLLNMPFVWYANLFFRISHGVSRRQEYIADELAARTVGATALSDGLRQVHRSALAFDAYWRTEVLPVLNSGYRPPLSEGFSRFVAVNSIASALSRNLEEELTIKEHDPYDTHPPLRERLIALTRLPAGERPNPDLLAISLMTNIGELEHALLVSLAGEKAAGSLKPTDWDSIIANTYVPSWEKVIKEGAGKLTGVTVGKLPVEVKLWNKYGTGRYEASDALGDPDAMKARTLALLGSALAVTLHKNGWQLAALPGESIVANHDGFEIKPFEDLDDLATEKRSAGDWAEKVTKAGIADLRLD